jgi:sulfatase modifying factor 1
MMAEIPMVKTLLVAVGVVAAGAASWGITSMALKHPPQAAQTAPAIQPAPATVASSVKPGNEAACCMNLPKRFGALATTGPALGAPVANDPRVVATAGMKWIPGGQFTMGGNDPEGRADERPPHPVRVSGFWMDETDVTNAQFRKFVEATGYVTTAEKKPDWEQMKAELPPGTPKPPEDQFVAASLVFHATPGPVSLDDYSQWWSWTPGADWRHPEGPGSSIEGKDDYPVVQVSWDDAMAYARWAGKQLPTEAQWEFAARGGAEGEKYFWGNEDPTDTGPVHCNIWQGHFPDQNTAHDGYERSSPVHAFAPNGYGLYDMAGNVWQWCADWYRPDTYSSELAQGVVKDPTGPEKSLDPDEPYTPKRVTRGGSFLCNAAYCSSYRLAARMKASPDSGTNHTGFRCVVSGPAGK